MVRSPAKDEEMLVYAFKKGVLPGPFGEALIRAHPATFAEVRRLAVAHIADESEVAEKRGSVAPVRPRAQTRVQPQRVLETAAAARKDQRTRYPYDRSPERIKGLAILTLGETREEAKRANRQHANNQHAGNTIARLSTNSSWD